MYVVLSRGKFGSSVKLKDIRPKNQKQMQKKKVKRRKKKEKWKEKKEVWVKKIFYCILGKCIIFKYFKYWINIVIIIIIIIIL